MGPKYDVVAVRKDGEEQTFTRSFDDKEITSKFRKVGAVWERDGKLSMSFEEPITKQDIEDCWFNLYERQEKQQTSKKANASKTQTAKKPVGPKKEDVEDDDELDD